MPRSFSCASAALLLLAAFSVAAQEAAPAVVHLSEALRFPTISHQDSEQVDTEAFESFLAFVRRTYPSVFATLEVEPVNRYSLLLRWPGKQSGLAPVLFDAHYDVVPIEPGTQDDWTHPPFSGSIADGYVWGRGALDDKIAVITTLEALEALVKQGFSPGRTLYFSFVHDEETGGERGAGGVVDLLQSRGIRCEYVVGEGGGVVDGHPMLPNRTVATVALAEKTYLTLILRSTGTGGHSSMPPPRLRDRAPREGGYEAARESLRHAARLSGRRHGSGLGEYREGFAGLVMRNPGWSRPLILSQMQDSPIGSAMVRTTTAVTMIDGGVKENVVPQRAEARVNFRVLPDEGPDEVIAAVKALIDDPSIEIESSMWSGNPGVSDVDTEGYATIRSGLEAAIPDVVVLPGMLMAGQGQS